jgi:diaminopimelate epimerase
MAHEFIAFIKAHAYGNDFLLIDEDAVLADDAKGVATSICDRHSGIGADGLILYRITATGAAMKLFNADGSVAEVSGNGVRCLGAIVADDGVGGETVIETDGGLKKLTLLEAGPPRYTFRAFMGSPGGLQEMDLDVGGESVRVVVLSVGNPQCIVLTDRLDEARFRRLGPLLATHEAFPDGTNVEFVQVERSDRVNILIWERGVGPTTASGTGACASAVVASAFGGADRSLDIVSSGGSQHVERRGDGIYLTGWAAITARGEWFIPVLA